MDRTQYIEVIGMVQKLVKVNELQNDLIDKLRSDLDALTIEFNILNKKVLRSQADEMTEEVDPDIFRDMGMEDRIDQDSLSFLDLAKKTISKN